MLLSERSKEELEQVKDLLKLEFERKDMGSAKRILGIGIERSKKEHKLYISQVGYCEKLI